MFNRLRIIGREYYPDIHKHIQKIFEKQFKGFCKPSFLKQNVKVRLDIDFNISVGLHVIYNPLVKEPLPACQSPPTQTKTPD